MAVIYFVMGVSGSGKTTIAERLAELKNLPLFDADDFHTAENKAKMSTGLPLTDQDRQGWLEALNRLAREHDESAGAVIACSALKERYRRILIDEIKGPVHWIVLKGGHDVIHQRMIDRKDHFMPAGLLTSQLDSMEYPPYGLHINIVQSPDAILEHIVRHEMSSDFGLAGLGVMGKSLARNLGTHGVKLSLYNQHVDGKEEQVAEKSIAQYPELKQARGFDQIAPFVQSLSTPRKIFLMVPAGEIVDHLIALLIPHLNPGDIIMDGGNSHFKDTERRYRLLKSQSILYLGVGVSGGEQGALTGPAIMPGGDLTAYQSLQPMLDAIAAKDPNGKPCCAYIGSGGSGHFVKMIHNGIEYAEMQLLAEVYWIMKMGLGYTNTQMATTLEDWSHTATTSYLLEITVKILRHKTGDEYTLDLIADISGSKGTGGWSLTAATELGVTASLISESLFARFVSSLKTERLRNVNLTSSDSKPMTITIDQLRIAYDLARLINHHQGFEILRAGSKQYQWNLNLSELARVWTSGCIIRSSLMQTIQSMLVDKKSLLESNVQVSRRSASSLSTLVSESLRSGVPVPALSAAINYLLAYHADTQPANLIQAQRDFFGAHTYRKMDDPFGKSYHTDWESETA